MSKQPERRRRVVRATAPAFGLLAAGLLVWQGSYAAFSATTQDNSNTWSSATLSLLNDGGVAGAYAATTTATFGGTNLKPGATGTTCLTVKSAGTSAGNMAMYVSSLVDSSPSLGVQIKLTVDAAPTGSEVVANCTGFPAVGVTNVATNLPLTGALPAVFFPTTYAGGVPVAVATGTILTAYKVTWTFATTGTNPGDNLLQGKTVTAGFTWELQ
jgi:hypothetical protein